jgi:hypothetical protein
MRMHVCYLDCHEAGLLLLPSDIHGTPIMSITAVLLPFVTYVLTVPCILY